MIKYKYMFYVFLLSVLAGSSLSAAQTTKLSDAEIFAIFDQANTADIETGALGIKRGHSEQVRALGRMVVKDHTAVRQMARDIARSINLQPKLSDGDSSVATHQAKLKQLSQLSAAEFDKQYLLHEIEFHTNAIAAIKQVLIPNAQCLRFKELAKKVLPGFEHHLQETRRVARELGYI